MVHVRQYEGPLWKLSYRNRVTPVPGQSLVWDHYGDVIADPCTLLTIPVALSSAVADAAIGDCAAVQAPMPIVARLIN